MILVNENGPPAHMQMKGSLDRKLYSHLEWPKPSLESGGRVQKHGGHRDAFKNRRHEVPCIQEAS